MKQYCKLYTKDSMKRIRVCDIKYDDTMCVYSKGLLDTKKPQYTEYGKKQQMSGENKAEQLKTLCLRENYIEAESPEDFLSKWDDNEILLLPNLLVPITDYMDKIKELNECFIQPKLDGVRCIVRYNKDTGDIYSYSRQGTEIKLHSKLLNELKILFNNLTNQGGYLTHRESKYLYLDGELYNHNENFSEIYSKVSTSEFVKYHIFDIASQKEASDIFVTSYFVKIKWIEKSLIGVDYKIIDLVRSHNMSQEHINTDIIDFILSNYEGLVIREIGYPYIPNKRDFIYKYKPEKRRDITIMKAFYGNGRNEDVMLAVVKLDDNESTFSVSMTKEVSDILKSMKFQERKGIKGTIKFYEYTSKNTPKHATLIGLN